MDKTARWNDIINLCKAHEKVTVQELVDTLHVSPATIRRDLAEMEDLKMVSRYHGGVMITSSQINEPGMAAKQKTNQEAKKQIAWTASRLIHDNMMIYLDAGSSTYEMIPFIHARNITIVTPGVPHLTLLGERDIPTIVLGGKLYWQTASIIGRQALNMLKEMYFDIAFVGTNGIHEKAGFTTSNEQEADTKAMAIRHAKDPYILADASKFNVLRTVPFAALNEATIITDRVPDFDLSLIHYLTPEKP
jgi:DeoR family fructose operon transcriptional repressor